MNKLKVLIAVLVQFVGSDLARVIKEKALEAAAREDWGPGEKTKFVEDAARAAAAATVNPFDDFFVDVLIRAYNKKYGIS